MRNIKQHLKELKKKGLVFHTTEQVFKEASPSPAFKKAYSEEMARLKLAGQIKHIRLAKRLTQEMVAKKAIMPQSVIARIESGKHSYSLGTLYRVARAVNKEIQLV